MSSNTALVTEAAKVAAQDLLQDYSNGVVGHMGGDWSGHLQMNVKQANFSSGAGIIAVHVLRMLLEDGSTDTACIVPALEVGVAPVTVKPVIIKQPLSLTVKELSKASFTVFAASPGIMVFQWFHNGNIIVGANGSTFTLVSAKLSDAGTYVVSVANSAGTVTSTPVTLQVTFAG